MRIPLVHSYKLTNDKIILTFESGENRYFLLENLVNHLNTTGFAVFTLEDIKMIDVRDGTIKFLSKSVSFKKRNGEVINDYYDLDPYYIYEDSLPMEETIGELFKKYRLNQGMSASEVAKRCKTDKGFISKFENNKLQVEWNTVRRLFFLGFGKTVNLEMMFSNRVRRVDKYLGTVTFLHNKGTRDLSLQATYVQTRLKAHSLEYNSFEPKQSIVIKGLAPVEAFQSSRFLNLETIANKIQTPIRYSKKASQQLDTAVKWQ